MALFEFHQPEPLIAHLPNGSHKSLSLKSGWEDPVAGAQWWGVVTFVLLGPAPSQGDGEGELCPMGESADLGPRPSSEGPKT